MRGVSLKGGGLLYVNPRLQGAKERATLGFVNIKYKTQSVLTPLEKQEKGYWSLSSHTPLEALYRMACSGENTVKEVLTHPTSTVGCKELLDFLTVDFRLFRVTLPNLKEIALCAEQQQIPMDWTQRHPKTQKSLLEHVAEHLDSEWIKLWLGVCREDFLAVINKKGIVFQACLQAKREWIESLAEAFDERALSDENRKLLRAFQRKEVDFSGLSSDRLLQLYIAANTHGHREWVKKFHALGMQTPKGELAPIRKPSILSPDMDLLQVEEVILAFLLDLRRKRLLLTESEFTQMDRDQWVHKGHTFSRLLGRNYVEETAAICEFRSIKVPTKLLVLENPTVAIHVSDKLELLSYDCVLCAQRIVGVERFLTREEMEEVYLTIQLTKYKDIHSENFLMTKESVYFIDTESNDFGVTMLDRSDNLLKMVAPEDYSWLEKILRGEDLVVNARLKALQEKITAPREVSRMYGFKEPFVFQAEKIL